MKTPRSRQREVKDRTIARFQSFVEYVIERSSEQLELTDESTRSMLEAFIEDGIKILKQK